MDMSKVLTLSAAIALALGTTLGFAAGKEPTFDQCDTNHDGSISRSEAKSCHLSIDWSKADTDANGSLDRSEYDAAVKGMEKEAPGGAPGGTSPGGGM
jgi:hypothetical protein